MIIRKEFKFENAHIVRGCSSVRCRSSLHGHSYRVEVKFSSNFLDNGEMVYDFGLMKRNIKDIIDSFDHAVTIWSGDESTYIADMKRHSARFVVVPVSPSAEQFSRLFFLLIERLMQLTSMQNGEKEVALYSVRVHETATGYAEAFREDAHSEAMGKIELREILFSDAIRAEWHDSRLFEKLLLGERFVNPTSV